MYFYLYLYFAVISLTAVIVTIADKIRAVKDKWRVSENALMIIALLGGGISMYITMLIIRHKTRKLKFMLGIPLIIILETIALLWVLNYAAQAI